MELSADPLTDGKLPTLQYSVHSLEQHPVLVESYLLELTE